MKLFFAETHVCLFRCHGNEYCLWILVSTHSERVETVYFPLYSPIAIFAEYFVSFLDEIDYKQLLREFTSVVNYIRCNMINFRLFRAPLSSDKTPSKTVRLLCTHRRNPFMLVLYDSSISFTRRLKHSVRTKIKPSLLVILQRSTITTACTGDTQQLIQQN